MSEKNLQGSCSVKKDISTIPKSDTALWPRIVYDGYFKSLCIGVRGQRILFFKFGVNDLAEESNLPEGES